MQYYQGLSVSSSSRRPCKASERVGFCIRTYFLLVFDSGLCDEALPFFPAGFARTTKWSHGALATSPRSTKVFLSASYLKMAGMRLAIVSLVQSNKNKGMESHAACFPRSWHAGPLYADTGGTTLHICKRTKEVSAECTYVVYQKSLTVQPSSCTWRPRRRSSSGSRLQTIGNDTDRGTGKATHFSV